jgi:transposase
MEHYAGIDVSLECSSVCVVDASGKIVREGKVASEPEALIAWFGSLGFGLVRIGLEAGPLSQWLYAAMQQAGLAVELLETRHVRDAFKAMPVKSDRNDARGIAQLIRLGWFRPVHCKSLVAQEVRAFLTARKLVQSKLFDIEMSLRGILRGFGLKVGPTTPLRFT